MAAIVNIYKRYNFVLFPAIVVLATLILGVFVIYPQINKAIADQSKIDEETAKTTLLEKKADQLNRIDSQDLKDKMEIVLKNLPPEADFANTLGLIQLIANRYQFNIVGFQTGGRGSDDKSKLSSYSINLDYEGPKALVKGFLDAINSSYRLMRSTNMSVTLKAGEAITSNINIEVFYSLIPTQVGAIDSPLSLITTKDEEFIKDLSSKQLRVGVVTTPTGPVGKSNPFE